MGMKEVFGTRLKNYSKTLVKVLIIFFVVIGCNKDSKIKPYSKWIDDKYGCKNYRNIDLAESMVLKYNMINNFSESDFVEIFGNPNLVEGNLLSKEIFYLCQSNCENEVLNKNSDKCYIIFSFKFGVLKSVRERCE